jgi:hypothetical protein
VQAARGFKRCDVTLIPNGAVIVRFYEQRLFVCRKTRFGLNRGIHTVLVKKWVSIFHKLISPSLFWPSLMPHGEEFISGRSLR